MKENPIDIRSILIAEDDITLLHPLKKLFEDNGFLVFIAENGAIAIERYHNNRPDILLLDIDMPEMSGYEVCDEIRLTDHITPIIIMSGAMILEEDCLSSYDRGAYIYFRKPFYPREVLACVTSILNMLQQTPKKYVFGNSSLDLYSSVLRVDKDIFILKDRETKALRLLLKYSNQIVPKNDLLLFVWKNMETNNYQMLRNMISELKKKLNHDKTVSLDTVYRQGFMLRYNK